MIPRPSSRRAAIDRWIVSLNPMFEVIQARVRQLGIGEPRLQVGPTMIHSSRDDSSIRRGAVWFVDGKNTGFHVDFKADGVGIQAWCGGERRASLWVAGKVTEGTLKRDLKTVLAAAGLSDLSKSQEVRDDIFRRPQPVAESR